MEDDIRTFNTRVIGKNELKFWKELQGYTCYACPMSKEKNAVTATGFYEHLKQTC